MAGDQGRSHVVVVREGGSWEGGGGEPTAGVPVKPSPSSASTAWVCSSAEGGGGR